MGISFTSLAVVAAAAFAAPLLEPVQVLALIGLSFLLLIAGLEVDDDRLRGRLLRVTGLGFVVSLALGLGAGLALHGAGQDMGLISAANAAAVIAAGLLSVLLFPAGALSLLRTAVEPREAETPSLAATQH